MDEHNSTTTSEEEYAASESDSEGEESIGSSTSSAPSNRRRRNHERVTWADRYQDLKAFIEEHDGAFPKRRTSLGTWISDQRKPSKLNALSTEKIRLLEKLNVFQSRLEQKWSFMFSLLREYQLEHGHTRVLVRDTYKGDTKKLAIWVRNQQKRLPSLAAAGNPVYKERKRRLDALDFAWVNVDSNNWEVMFTELKQFHEEHGHHKVPRGYKDEVLPENLCNWVTTQRRTILEEIEEGNEIASCRKKRLDELGFVWQTRHQHRQHNDKAKVIGKRKAANYAAVKVASEGQSKRSRPVLQRTAKLPPGDDRNGEMVEFLQCDSLGDLQMGKKPSGRDRRRQRDGTKPQSFSPAERTEDHVERDLPTFDQRREKNDTAAAKTNEKENNLQMTSPCPQKRRKKQNWRNFPLVP